MAKNNGGRWMADRNNHDITALTLLDRFLTTDGVRHVCLRGEDVYVWNRMCWQHASGGFLRREIWRALSRASVEVQDETTLKDGSKKHTTTIRSYNPNRRLVGDVHDAVLVLCKQIKHDRAPHWIGESDDLPPANEMFPMINGLVHVRTGRLCPPTPRFFNLWVSPVAHDSDAQCPVWDRFQASVYEGRHDNIMLMTEWFGYCMIGYDKEGKLIVRQGRPGGGKSTEWRMLEHILGSDGMVSLAMSQLAGDDKHAGAFLQDKAVLVVPDASVERGAETKRMIAIVKQLSGGDGLTARGMGRVNSGDKSFAKVYICTNKTLRFPDEAMQRRLLLQKSDVEYAPTPNRPAHPDYDPHLEDKLVKELPGIVNRCIDGAKRLLERGGFIQPEYGRDMLGAMIDHTDDLSVFIRRHCVTDRDARTPMCDLLDAYNRLYGPSEGFNYKMKPGAMKDRLMELHSETALHIIPETRARSIVGDSPSGYVVTGLSLNDESSKALLPLITDAEGKRRKRVSFASANG